MQRWHFRIDKFPLRWWYLSKDLEEVRKAALQLSGGNSFQAKGAVGAKVLRREWKNLSCWKNTRTSMARTDCLRKEEARPVCMGQQSLFCSHCMLCPSLPLPDAQVPGVTHHLSIRWSLFVLLKDSSWFLGFCFYFMVYYSVSDCIIPWGILYIA